MTVTRGEIWTAELDPTQGSEQAGRRPALRHLNCKLRTQKVRGRLRRGFGSRGIGVGGYS
jgi:hypothetical protein